MGDINFTNFLSDRLMGCYPEGASYCCFRKTVSNNIFQKVLLINFISTSGSAFHFCSLPADRRLQKVCTMKGARHCFYRRTVYNSYFEKVLLINLISPYSKLLKHFNFVHILLIEGCGKCTLGKKKVIAFLQSNFKQLLRKGLTDKFHQPLLQIALAFHFCSFSADGRLWKVCSTKGSSHCSFYKVF